MRGMTLGLMLMVPMALHGQRQVSGNRITSTTLPAAMVEAASGMQYAGSQSFDLYGVAAVEQHFFVDLDGTRVRRMLWIQFEGYHATNSHTYNYTDTTITHSGQTWHRRRGTWRPFASAPRTGSDAARVLEFVAAKGWTLGTDLLNERLVWLLDSPPRNELMIIYLEDLADHGLTVQDIALGGSARDQRTALLDGFHDRALAAFTVRRPG